MRWHLSLSLSLSLSLRPWVGTSHVSTLLLLYSYSSLHPLYPPLPPASILPRLSPSTCFFTPSTDRRTDGRMAIKMVINKWFVALTFSTLVDISTHESWPVATRRHHLWVESSVRISQTVTHHIMNYHRLSLISEDTSYFGRLSNEALWKTSNRQRGQLPQDLYAYFVHRDSRRLVLKTYHIRDSYTKKTLN